MFRPKEEPPLTPPPTVQARPVGEVDDELTAINAVQRPTTASLPIVPLPEAGWQLQPPPARDRHVRYITNDRGTEVTVRRWLSRRVPATNLWWPLSALFAHTEYRPYEHQLSIKEDGDVDLTLVGKLDFIPREGETELRYLRRHHWWMILGGERHRKWMIFADVWWWALLWFVVTTCYVGWRLDAYGGSAGTALLYAGFIAVLIYAGIRWVRWWSTYLLVTNKRLQRIRNYPFIPRKEQSVELVVLGNRSITRALLLNYATYRAGTPEEGDAVAWIEKSGIRYLANYKVFDQCASP